MKFEKFAKKAVPHAACVTVGNSKYLAFNGVYALIPSWCGNIGIESKENEELDDILNNADWSNCEASLTSAYLPNADDKAKDIVRVFSDDEGGKVGISNENFALIEKTDMCVIATNEDGKTALLVGKYADIEDFEPDAIIIEVED